MSVKVFLVKFTVDPDGTPRLEVKRVGKPYVPMYVYDPIAKRYRINLRAFEPE